MEYDIEVGMAQRWQNVEIPAPVQKFNQPYFYAGLAEEERKAELLAEIVEENLWIGKCVAVKGDYVLRYSKTYGSYALLEEKWDGCKENFILEVRDETQAKDLLEIVAEHGRKIWDTINQLEKMYCKEKRAFMNYYGDEHRRIVGAFITGLKRHIKLEAK